MNNAPYYRPAKCCYTCNYFGKRHYMFLGVRESETICGKYNQEIDEHFICASYEEVKVVNNE